MSDFDDLELILDKSFWKAMRDLRKLNILDSEIDKSNFIKQLQEKLNSKSYSPGIPALEIISNKGEGIARRMQVFNVEDYAVYNYYIKKLEKILVEKRVEGTFGGWTISGPAIAREEEETTDSDHDYGRYSFNPNAWKKEYGEFNSLIL